MAGALEGIRVLDLTRQIAGPYATKLMADFGADVVKVEGPDGDPARWLGPFKDGKRDENGSGTFFFFNTNKRSVVLEPGTAAGLASFWRLAAWADVVVESFRPGTMEALGAGWEEIRARRPDLPLVSISDFGQHGPYRDYRGSDLVLYALAGEMHSMGRAEREPMKMYGTTALIQSGAAAANAILAAVLASRLQGIGQHVDFSIADSHFNGVDRRHATVVGNQFSGRQTLRAQAGAALLLQGLYPCADGWVDLAAGGERFMKCAPVLVGHPDWLEDPKWRDPLVGTRPEAIEEFNEHFYPWLLARTKREVWKAAIEAKVLCGPLFNVDEVFDDPNFRARGLWQRASTPELGDFEFPGRPFRMSETPWAYRRPAPRLGEHTAEVLREVEAIVAKGDGGGAAAGSLGVRSPAPTTTGGGGESRGLGRGAGVTAGRTDGGAANARRLPLDGVRVLDLTGVWAGTFGTLFLADLGAEVLKAENQFVWQPNTRSMPGARPTKAMLVLASSWAGGFPKDDPGPRPWNYHPAFVSLYRNKRSFTVDLRARRGMAIFARLVAMSDVVIENSAVGTMEKLGITDAWLREQKDDIIFVRAPGYGVTGDYTYARTFGTQLEGVMGHQLLRGYRDGDPSMNSIIFAADSVAGAQIAFATMAALWHRARTGKGQFIEMAQAENAAALFSQAYLDHALNGVVQEAIGNRSIYAEDGEVPQGVYPCASPGPAEEGLDRWIAITVCGDGQWEALREVMGDPDWAKAAELQTVAGRVAAQDLLDERLAAWTSAFDDYELFHRLQAAGIAAAPVLAAPRVLADPHVQAHDLYQPVQIREEIGVYRYPRPFIELPATPGGIRKPPVTFGEDNDYVYRKLLGVGDAEWEELVAEGHIATEFDESIR